MQIIEEKEKEVIVALTVHDVKIIQQGLEILLEEHPAIKNRMGTQSILNTIYQIDLEERRVLYPNNIGK